MASILDEFDYPWHKSLARELHANLYQLFDTGQQVKLLVKKAQMDAGTIFFEGRADVVWIATLEEAARTGQLRTLVEHARDSISANNPRRKFLEKLLAELPVPMEGEPRSADGAPNFLTDSDEVTENEALLYYDDLTIPIGKVPGLITTLQQLTTLAPSVCRLVVDINGRGQHGTGFRIGPDLLLTNWHVLHKESDGTRATAVTAEFGYEDDGKGGGLAATVIPCDVASIVTSQADDWAIIRATQALEDAWPVVKLSKAAEPSQGSSAYIIQHPGGDRKRVGFVRNQVSAFDDRVVHYLTDTQEGSSGSPVFDSMGRLIALHHAGGRPQQVVGKAPVKKNEGIRISRVVAGLAAQHVEVP
jgi:V8-like Glu-specific endopeptidase